MYCGERTSGSKQSSKGMPKGILIFFGLAQDVEITQYRVS